MFVFTFFSGLAIILMIVRYSEEIQKLFGVYIEDDEVIVEENENESDEESVSEDSGGPEDEIMADFYEETTLSDEWLSKSDEEKKRILDKEIDEYMAQKKQADEIQRNLKDIKC
jgi:hypothetical protein